MHLSALIDKPLSGLEEVEVTGLTADSRAVKPGFLFAALQGVKQDGRDFIPDAVKNGAVAVLAPEGTTFEDKSIALITDLQPRSRFAKMAAAFYGKQPQTVAAVTGTNGKSSTVNFCRQIWQALELPGASMGTIGVIAPGLERSAALTTADPVTLHADIAELVARGVTHLALEASSQGLDQFRLDGLHVTAAGFTNLTRDHLDYHGSLDKYFAAKARLFEEMLENGGVAVINADSEHAAPLIEICEKRGIRTLTYGENGRELRIEARSPLPHGQDVTLEVFGAPHVVTLPLVGDFQAMNALCALGLALAEKPDDIEFRQKAVAALESLQSVRGRLEFATRAPCGAAVYVDYAHTPDGLETMLNALRPHTAGRLHVVFGCGGDRDRGKRPMMGEIARRLADDIIVTDDNPRSEDAAAIRAEVMQGCLSSDAASEVHEIGGRRAAIRAAVKRLAPEDVLVIAGKGHEQGQIVGGNVLPFDDVTEARTAALEETG
ncbi:MAG: UDP-N-acetylmuramoyl-L-alanyl-D-glutamate--2,6-diaminopimelate ligase [Alphaproteobacteria bacterium]|nr:UDP-N-acetylmuramoyl-L-alanyl-D-glutamate--2,6-diaminopimelate ligase [Alphaproteobacteria bacterium]